MKRLKLLSVMALSVTVAMAQDGSQARPSSSMYLPALAKPDVSIAFNITDEGKRFNPTWGLDQAWEWDRWIYMGINHMGRENIGIGRTAFRFTTELTKDSILPSDAVQALTRRNANLNLISPTLPVVLTADQGASEGGKTPSYYVTNRQANNAHWAAMINSHVHWIQARTKHPVVGVSPFNEGDYWTAEEGSSATKQWQVAKLLKEDYPRFADIAIVGGNTLNNDQALSWYSSGSKYYDWGNTHQLAGSMNSYIAFYDRLQADGKIGYNDEMHNVAEAMIGLEHGMTVGIWWGFEGRARGEFCQISRHGVRLAYGEHRNNWTAASVYRHDDGRVKAFLGSSERQAVTTGYQFVSVDRDVYYDGYGPVREYFMEMPGGTGYQKNTPNAERVIDITWGDDVQQKPITDGIYKLYNLATGRLLAVSGSNIVVSANPSESMSAWNITLANPRQGCDYSYYDFTLSSNPAVRMNLKDFSTQSGAEIIAYSGNADKPDLNEQWYLDYAGDGFFYVRNRVSAYYLSASGDKVQQSSLPTSETARRNMKWRLLPADVRYERVPPATPTGLIAEAGSASVRLTWNANSETDFEGYNVMRTEKGADNWNTIARGVTTNSFTDNTCRQGVTYIYKVKAVDKAQNRSVQASDEVEATPTGAPSLVAHWQMDGTLNDETANMMDAVVYGNVTYADAEEGKSTGKTLRLANNSGSQPYVQLPYEVAGSEELTVAMWVRMLSNTTWLRLFDFGYDTDHYMFLTPSNGSVMRFAIKNGGDEQTVDTKSKLPTGTWKHVAVTIGKGKTAIYVDGEEAASSTSVTISPADVRPVLNYLGRSQFVADPMFQGQYDDVRIYNYALTADDVKTIMGGGSPAGVSAPVMDTGSTAVYDLNGIRQTAPKRGINIIDGKKVMK